MLSGRNGYKLLIFISNQFLIYSLFANIANKRIKDVEQQNRPIVKKLNTTQSPDPVYLAKMTNVYLCFVIKLALFLYPSPQIHYNYNIYYINKIIKLWINKKKETAFAKKKKTGRETDGKGGKSDEGLGKMEGRGVTYLTDH